MPRGRKPKPILQRILAKIEVSFPALVILDYVGVPKAEWPSKLLQPWTWTGPISRPRLARRKATSKFYGVKSRPQIKLKGQLRSPARILYNALVSGLSPSDRIFPVQKNDPLNVNPWFYTTNINYQNFLANNQDEPLLDIIDLGEIAEVVEEKFYLKEFWDMSGFRSSCHDLLQDLPDSDITQILRSAGLLGRLP